MVTGSAIQVEDGEYTRVHNAILEALAKARLSGAEFRCVHFLLRKTYGWGKKEDRISLSQWAAGTDSKRPHVLAALNELIRKKVIYRRMDGGQIPVYGFNKYIETWENVGVDAERGKRFSKSKVLPEQVTVTSTGNSTVTCSGNETVTRTGTHKRNKESIKETPEHKKLFGALVRICRVDAKLKAGQIGRTAKSLVSAGYVVEDLELFERWWRTHDFRGQRGDPPTLAQVIDKILQAKQETKPPAPLSSEPVTIVVPGVGFVEARS